MDCPSDTRLHQLIVVSEQNWAQCQITQSNATVFKYGEEFYTFTPTGMDTSRIVRIHLDPLNEVYSGVDISLCKATYSPDKPCYELHDPLDPWTEAAIEDPINDVKVDGIYRSQCALFNPDQQHTLKWEQLRTCIFKYQGEYYAVDGFGLYDGFRPWPTFRVPILIGWIVIGFFWLGSGPFELMRTRKKGGDAGDAASVSALNTFSPSYTRE
ncbi:MAG: hypothetical protein JSV35_03855 [Candidatus Bathyarchaeota archaeon]|nr:MAG: hypothetical protein JSV35_03855 [Candidatus Bathyarchaeota archaeon]